MEVKVMWFVNAMIVCMGVLVVGTIVEHVVDVIQRKIELKKLKKFLENQ
jgi:hypothetical protein